VLAHSGIVDRCMICIAMFFAVHSYAADAAEWGQAVNGLRMSISIVPAEGGPGYIKLVLQNAGNKDLSVGPFHTVGGVCDVFDFVNVFWKDSGGAVSVVRRTRGGSSRPCSVPLFSGEERSFVKPISFEALPQRGEFWAEYEPRADEAKAGCGAVPCWAGKIVSNTLVIPH